MVEGLAFSLLHSSLALGPNDLTHDRLLLVALTKLAKGLELLESSDVDLVEVVVLSPEVLDGSVR